MSKPTDCITCDNVVEHTRRKHPSQWLCIKAPRLNGYGFVDPTWCDEAYMRCIGINGGKCSMYTEIREQPDAPVGKRVHRSDFEQN
jgi:hypothetical protein